MATRTTEPRLADWVAAVVLVAGALLWGLVGLGGLLNTHGNIVDLAFAFLALVVGPAETLEHLLYLGVGLTGVYAAYRLYGLGATRESGADTPSDAD